MSLSISNSELEYSSRAMKEVSSMSWEIKQDANSTTLAPFQSDPSIYELTLFYNISKRNFTTRLYHGDCAKNITDTDGVEIYNHEFVSLQNGYKRVGAIIRINTNMAVAGNLFNGDSDVNGIIKMCARHSLYHDNNFVPSNEVNFHETVIDFIPNPELEHSSRAMEEITPMSWGIKKDASNTTLAPSLRDPSTYELTLCYSISNRNFTIRLYHGNFMKNITNTNDVEIHNHEQVSLEDDFKRIGGSVRINTNMAVAGDLFNSDPDMNGNIKTFARHSIYYVFLCFLLL
eukprot:CAMPEP_0172486270 /NCGR_PEP_ID=MMETSP1066-20121228/14784_1 /TAXON_ID=671091 /ORGANISM="Coscinodiscus wailesii, Strain CCMP2513" /LENGTH=287 /DNA_ID=CAMNT_0013252117 /DNA_START=154 /DNA_END=1014 /DNA_ORIENTATION=+